MTLKQQNTAKGRIRPPMLHPPALKASLKRGAFIAAANWPLIVVQFIADGTLKLLLAVPVLGGIFLVVLLLGADVEEVLAGDVRAIIGAVVVALGANPVALTAFGAAFLLVLLGGSAFTFVVKAGTVAIMAEAEAQAGPIERPPLRLKINSDGLRVSRAGLSWECRDSSVIKEIFAIVDESVRQNSLEKLGKVLEDMF